MADDKIENMSFEQALEELENIVTLLERGDAPLDESIDICERGAKLKQYCEGKLKAAKLKVDKIVLGSDGTPKTEPFDPD